MPRKFPPGLTIKVSAWLIRLWNQARLSRVPLIVLTADRPPELRDTGAAQTIDQVRMFGSNAKWTVDMPLPDFGGQGFDPDLTLPTLVSLTATPTAS